MCFGLGLRPGWWNLVDGQQGATTLAEGNLLQATYLLSIKNAAFSADWTSSGCHVSAGGAVASNAWVKLTSLLGLPRVEVDLFKANPTSGGVTASTEMLAAKRHAGVHTPVIVGKMIIANQQMAYAA